LPLTALVRTAGGYRRALCGALFGAALVLLAACGETPADSPRATQHTAAEAPVGPTSTPSATAERTRPQGALSPLVASDDADDADDGKTPRKVVRGRLRMPGGATLPAGTLVVGLRRVWLPNVSTLRPGTWTRAPRAPVDADGRFELPVPGHWNSLIVYADGPTLWDHPLLRLERVPPAHELEVVVQPCSALSGHVTPVVLPCPTQPEQERVTLRLDTPDGPRRFEIGADGAFEFGRLPSASALTLTLESSGHAATVQTLELAPAEARVLPTFGAPLARQSVRVLDARGGAIAGARVELESNGPGTRTPSRVERRERTSGTDGGACVPIPSGSLSRLRVDPPPGAGPWLGTLYTFDRRKPEQRGGDWIATLPDALRLEIDVQDPNGMVLPRAHALLLPISDAHDARGCLPGEPRRARCDAQGRLAIDALYDAPYRLELWGGFDPERGGLRATLERTPDAVPSAAPAVVRLMNAPSHLVELRLLTADRLPWPELRGRFLRAREALLEFEDTLVSSGPYTRLRLYDGLWRIDVRDEKPGGPGGSVEIELPRDAGKPIEIVLRR
jgi:hypothetical protein